MYALNIKQAVVVLAAVLMAGCSQPAPPAPMKSAPKEKLAPPAPLAADAAALGAPPPPPPTAVAAVPAPPPGAPGQTAPVANSTSPEADALFYFRRGESGRVLSDLEALQEAADAYGRKAGVSVEGNRPAWPNLTNLSQLVQYGMLKALPVAADGRQYSFDAKSRKVGPPNP